MKLNNKGFAITAVLYGLLILFVVLVSSYLLVLSAKKDRVDNLVNEISEDYTNTNDTFSYVLSEHIKYLYNNSLKTTITNNNIEYNYATEANLMNDRLGGTTEEYNAGNIRYYGSNPNNYIYFNCSNYQNQRNINCEKWRIIGVFGGKVKIVNNSSIGTYRWDYNEDTTYDNDWHNSSLMNELNNTYYNDLKNAYTRNLISENTWYLGGYTKAEYYPDQAYLLEQTGTKCTSCTYDLTWDGNIGVIYPADYGYAVNFEQCNLDLSDYHNVNCKNQNWLFKPDIWLLAPHGSHGKAVWFINSDGRIGGTNGASTYSNYKKQIYPTLYLQAETIIYKGDGSSSNPYQIKVS